ncbi:LysR family transcriptional regulator [Amycolatopsis sp.]|jgi:DNA-binding transcriptional LysR family regulator|uniref:LysR family transcriptional regulator n=1 Tax=Amycolatopsis sp. TaxID=37632 RepID=UPI002E05F024|nr:LysR family transcriptional regulator [Amycolatopsis sp.]
MTDLEVRELRYFQAVAEELNFSRAATKLGIAQPPLSRAIKQLERRLGVALFERTTHCVTLTAPGRTLLVESARVLDAVAAAARRTTRAGLSTPRVVVTAKPGVATDLLRRLAEAYRATPGAAEVEIAVSGYGEQAAMVRDGRADAALIGMPGERRGLDWELIASERRVAALPAGHELASKSELSCRDLAGLPVPVGPESTVDQLAYWAGQDGELGAPPVTGPEVRDSSQLLETVALGLAVALVPVSLAKRSSRDDIVFRPVPDASPYVTALSWRSGSHDPHVAQFVRVGLALG